MGLRPITLICGVLLNLELQGLRPYSVQLYRYRVRSTLYLTIAQGAAHPRQGKIEHNSCRNKVLQNFIPRDPVGLWPTVLSAREKAQLFPLRCNRCCGAAPKQILRHETKYWAQPSISYTYQVPQAPNTKSNYLLRKQLRAKVQGKALYRYKYWAWGPVRRYGYGAAPHN